MLLGGGSEGAGMGVADQAVMGVARAGGGGLAAQAMAALQPLQVGDAWPERYPCVCLLHWQRRHPSIALCCKHAAHFKCMTWATGRSNLFLQQSHILLPVVGVSPQAILLLLLLLLQLQLQSGGARGRGQHRLCVGAMSRT
jgi:hypothetical protein